MTPVLPPRRASCLVLVVYRDGQAVEALNVGDAGVVVLDNTPFYAESGGQVGDRGTIGSFDVQDTQKLKGRVFGHHGVQKDGTLKVGDRVKAVVTDSIRRETMRNHTATHMLNRALRDVHGALVAKTGSLVAEEREREGWG